MDAYYRVSEIHSREDKQGSIQAGGGCGVIRSQLCHTPYVVAGLVNMKMQLSQILNLRLWLWKVVSTHPFIP